MKNNSFVMLLTTFLLLLAPAAWAGNLEQGSELFLFNKPAEAAPFLEKALKEAPTDPRIPLWLGFVYEQLNQYDKAIGHLRSALDRGIGDQAVLCLNIGNNYARKGNIADALKYYDRAIGYKPAYSLAILNRGNVYVRSGELMSALGDYENFLSLEPKHTLSPDVARMIAAIRDEMGAREFAKKMEAERLIAEAQRQQDLENQRLASAEKARKEEEERKKMLASIFDSLNDATNEQKNLSAGTEDLQNKQGELTREE